MWAARGLAQVLQGSVSSTSSKGEPSGTVEEAGPLEGEQPSAAASPPTGFHPGFTHQPQISTTKSG